MENQHALGRRIVQPRSGERDLLWLAEGVASEQLNVVRIADSGQGRAELVAQLPPVGEA